MPQVWRFSSLYGQFLTLNVRGPIRDLEHRKHLQDPLCGLLMRALSGAGWRMDQKAKPCSAYAQPIEPP
jgi:hypothetical protein